MDYGRDRSAKPIGGVLTWSKPFSQKSNGQEILQNGRESSLPGTGEPEEG